MTEQLFKIYVVPNSNIRSDVQKAINDKIAEGWRIAHLASAGVDRDSCPTISVVFERTMSTGILDESADVSCSNV